MLRFKEWFDKVLLESEQPLRKEQHDQVEKLYNQTVQLLLGGAKDQTHLSLSDIEDDSGGPDRPPTQKGAQVVLKKLEKAQLFDRIEKLQIPTLTQRAHDVRNYLQKLGNDQQIGPKDTVGQLLNKLFGDNAVELYGKGLWKTAPSAPKQAPEGNAQGQMPQDATAPPAAADGAPPAAAPPADPAGGMGEPNMPGMPPMGMPQPGMPPMGGPPGGMPPMGGPPPLQSPGGPMPPMPPGGMF